jgi:predicted nucleic acid-binding protein
MTLVDSSVWIDHFAGGVATLKRLLLDYSAGVHPFVLGELACGTLRHRAATVADLKLLPQVPIASEAEVIHLLESRQLWGRGLGWVDLHLLTAAKLSGWELLTADRAMLRAALAVGIEAHGSRD